MKNALLSLALLLSILGTANATLAYVTCGSHLNGDNVHVGNDSDCNGRISCPSRSHPICVYKGWSNKLNKAIFGCECSTPGNGP